MTLAAMILLMVWATWARWSAADRTPDAFAQKLAEADQVTFYVMSPSRGPEFRLTGGERHLKLITHLRLPVETAVPWTNYNPERTYAYGIEIILRGPDGGEFWRRRLHTTTRQSKADWNGDFWHSENSFVGTSTTQIADDRVFMVGLDEQVPVNTLMEVRLIGEADQVGFLRAYDIEILGTTARTIRELSLSPWRKHALVRDLTFEHWDELAIDQRIRRLQHGATRMAAERDDTRGQRTFAFNVTNFRIDHGRTIVDRGIALPLGVAHAFNVVGPGFLSLTLREHERRADIGGIARVDIEILQRDGRVQRIPWHFERQPGRSHDRRVPLPADVMSVFVQAADDAAMRLWAEATEGASAFDPEIEGRIRGSGMRPRTVLLAMYRIGRDASPLIYSLSGYDREERSFRIRARQFGEVDTMVPTAVRVDFLGPDFGPISSTTLVNDTLATRFQYGSDPEQPQLEAIPVSEALDLRVIAPPHTQAVQLTSEQPLVASVAVLDRDGAQPWASPYDQPELEVTTWRQAPRRERHWHTLRPDPLDVHGIEVEKIFVIDQTRLELLDIEAEDPNTRWRTVEPLGRPWKHSVFERAIPDPSLNPTAATQPEVAEDTTRDDATLWWSFPQNELRSLAIQSDDPTLPRLVHQFELDDPRVRAELRVTANGRLRARELYTSRGRVNLSELEAGVHVLHVSGPPGRLWLDRQHRGPSDSYAYFPRTLYRPGRNRLVYPVHKAGADAVSLNLAVYRAVGGVRDANPAPPRIWIEIDGGEPELRTGVPVHHSTRGRRRLELAAEVPKSELVFLDRSRSAEVFEVWSLAVMLGEDICAGHHRVEVFVETGDAVWFRAFRKGAPERPPRSWRSSGKFEQSLHPRPRSVAP